MQLADSGCATPLFLLSTDQLPLMHTCPLQA